MSISPTLAMLTKGSKIQDSFDSLFKNPLVKVSTAYGNQLNTAEQFQAAHAAQQFFESHGAYTIPDKIDFIYTEISSLKEDFNGIELEPRDLPIVGFFLYKSFQEVFGNKEELFTCLMFNNSDIRHIDNFLGVYTVEFIFKNYIQPKYCWFTYIEKIDKIATRELNHPNILTPWKIYSDTMIFGPELVDSLRLKEINWKDTKIYFSKWVTDDILWLASPWGKRSQFSRVKPRYIGEYLTYMDATENIRQRHMKAVSEKLELETGSWV